ncbi:MAG: HD domain-containing phosphohydrolase, partial [Gemmatimonadota bacterium]
VTAQIVCIADVFDALTTQRSYRSALSAEVALDEMSRSRHWWDPKVYEAFLMSMTVPDPGTQASSWDVS